MGKNGIAYFAVSVVPPDEHAHEFEHLRKTQLSVKAVKYEQHEFVREIPLKEALDVLSNHYTCEHEE
jgi:hypothetical protein